MKLVKNLTAAAVLVLALAVGSYAGDQQTPGLTPPPPPAQQTPGSACSQGTGTESQTPCTPADDEVEAPNPLVIDVITTLLGWF
ncbi:MAG TPA: hypothetical protein VKB46_08010 [Pyrinomonadaceae bacterium]|nr:hypothetical protein [Pyrinomonadaceae bacterium]